MPRKRTTFDVRAFKNRCDVITADPDLSAAERRVTAHLLECVLFETGNYRGFRYVDPKHAVEPGSDDSLRHYF